MLRDGLLDDSHRVQSDGAKIIAMVQMYITNSLTISVMQIESVLAQLGGNMRGRAMRSHVRHETHVTRMESLFLFELFVR